MELRDLRLQSGYYYLATPYSKHPAGIDVAFRDACVAAGALLAQGVHVYCPIAHTHPIATHGKLDHYSHDLFLPLDRQMMEHAHGIIVVEMPGHSTSRGVRFEIDYFDSVRRPRVHLNWPELRPVFRITQTAYELFSTSVLPTP